MAEKVLLKDILFNKENVTRLSKEVKQTYKEFDEVSFVEEVLSEFPNLELKQRITHIAELLKKYLPEDYNKAVKIILEALPNENDPTLSDNDFGEFIYAPYSDFVAKYGCSESNLETSLNALEQITKRFSGEDAIRYFINAFPDQTFEQLIDWSLDTNYHVRRLSSEGSRAKLPWSQKLVTDIERPLPILDNLFFDKTRYVTRSVANHMNDISKIDENLAMDTLEVWKKSGKQNQKEMSFIISHALRTLIKQGNARALSLLGYNKDAKVKVSNFIASDEVKLDNNLQFTFDIQADSDEQLISHFIIHFQNKSGEMKSKKVFTHKKFNMKKGETMSMLKYHPFKSNMSTRKLYTGLHKIELQINGKIVASKEFFLTS